MVAAEAVGAAGVPVSVGLAKLALLASKPPLAPSNSFLNDVPDATPKYSVAP